MTKRLTVLLIGIAMIFSLTGCSSVKKEEAKQYTGELLAAVAADDYEKANGLMHPDKTVTEDLLKEYFIAIEQRYNVDFSDGVNITDYTGSTFSLYDSEYDGSQYTLEYEFTVGTTVFRGSTQVIRNDSGIGINEFNVDLK